MLISMPFCKYCGREMAEGAKFCPNCGAAVVPDTIVPETTRVSGRRDGLKIRPTGITILVILEALVSLLTLVGGVALIGVAAFLATGGSSLISQQQLQTALQNIPWASGFTGVQLVALTTTFLTALGIVILVLAILGFVMAWGLWTGRGWARTITIILSVLSIIAGLFSLPGSIISILIYGAIIYYLTRPYVRNYYR